MTRPLPTLDEIRKMLTRERRAGDPPTAKRGRGETAPKRIAAVESASDHGIAESEGDPEGLLAAAAKQRKRAAKRRPAAEGSDGDEPRMADALAELDDEPPRARRAKPTVESEDEAPKARRARPAETAEREWTPPPEKPAKPRKRPVAKRQPLTDDIAVSAAARGPGLVTRGVQAGLGSIGGARRLGAWGAAALSAAVLVIGLSVQAANAVPPPAAVKGLRFAFHDGPTLPPEDVLGWIRRGFPQRARLADPDDDVLARLADYLRSHGAVRDVDQVRVVHEALEDGAVARVVEVRLALRDPYMPAMLANGERHWIDAEGRVLPGILPAPAVARPVLRGLEAGGPPAVAEALALWQELEPQVEPGLISEIRLYDDLDLANQRGVVLCTRQGSRLIWGRPGDDRFGVDRPRKIRDLVHTIRCQGDLSRIASINVRFAQPVFTLR